MRPAGSTGLDSKESDRRREARVSNQGGAYQVGFRFRDRRITTARLANLSAGGCGLEIQIVDAREMDVGSVLDDFLIIHPDVPCVPLEATVMRMLGKVSGKTSGYVLAGVEFTMITPFVKELIRSHVTALTEG